jgi:hypothetical protein
MNEKIYVHEVIDIIGPNRARYLYHITANWAPVGRTERNQVCFGVWGVVGTTKRFPEVINLWEEDGFDGLAASYRLEYKRDTLQNPSLSKWWLAAADMRSGGTDRLMLPAPWMGTIDEHLANGVTAEVFAHEFVRVRPHTARAYLDLAQDAIAAHERYGWTLVAALRTALGDDSEVALIWAIPTWEAWAAYEQTHEGDAAVRAWRERTDALVTARQRFLMREAPLSPFRLGRQPDFSDRIDDWTDEPN